MLFKIAQKSLRLMKPIQMNLYDENYHFSHNYWFKTWFKNYWFKNFLWRKRQYQKSSHFLAPNIGR